MYLRLIILLCFVNVVFAETKPGNAQPAVPAYRFSGASDQLNYELLNQLELLQQEVQLLRGQLEEQSYAIETLQKRQNSIYSDVDQRLQTLEGGGSAADQKAIEPDASQGAAVLPGVKSANQGGKVPGNEKQLYQDAYNKLRDGHYNQSIVMFEQILIDYPDGDFADNAQYWLGEAYKVNQDNDAARNAFEQVITLYPNSPKVPDAMLKLAYIEVDQQHWQQARKQLNNLIARFPGTAAANLAAEKLVQLERSQH